MDQVVLKGRRWVSWGLLPVLFVGGSLVAQTATARRGTAGEQRAARVMEAARGSALALRAFLERMPKGADLHMHLSGAVYAETFLGEAVEDALCVNPVTLSLAPNVGTREGKDEPVCIDPAVPAARMMTDQRLYDEMVDSFSMRGFVPTPGVSGHDQFFATFGRFSGLKSHDGEWLDEVSTRAAAQNEQYLEIMMTPSTGPVTALGARLGWPEKIAINDVAMAERAPSGTAASFKEAVLPAGAMAALRERLMADPVFAKTVAADREEIAAALRRRDEREHCGKAEAQAGCSVTIRVLFQVLRAAEPARVFAQTLLGFEVASADARVVGVNFVQPEDARLAMVEYERQMKMLDYLHGVYPKVHISLHAGELAPGLVPPDGLRFHIREAVEVGHAERIGHGVDVMYEERPEELLREMAARHVMVEINLTSNDVILGVRANEHSFPSYRRAGVPVALSTDDEGVSRIDLTHEYARAARDFNLSYMDLKTMARTGLEHSFLPGASLWAAQDAFGTMNPACAGVREANVPAACRDFLSGSEKAAQQWELERRFAAFEASLR